MTMLSDYVITSKLFYGLVHLAKKISTYEYMCCISETHRYRNTKLYCILLICSIVVWKYLFYKFGSKITSFITCYFSLNPCIAILRRCPSPRMQHHNLSEEPSCKKAKRIEFLSHLLSVAGLFGDSTRLLWRAQSIRVSPLSHISSSYSLTTPLSHFQQITNTVLLII